MKIYVKTEDEVQLKMAEKEDPKLISSHRHTKTVTTCRITISENDLETIRTDFP